MKFTFGLKNVLKGKKRGKIEEEWKYDSQSTLLAPPVIADLSNNGHKSIIFGTKDGKICSIDVNANVQWMFNTQEQVGDVELMFLDADTASSIESSPNIADINNDGKKEIVVGSEMGNIYALSYEGELLWKFKTEGSIRAPVLINDINGDGKLEILFGSGDKNLYVLNNEGKLLWQYEAGSSIESCPEIVKGNIVFGCDNGELHCINNLGKLIWKFTTNAKITAQPSVGKLFGDERTFIVVGSTDNYLYMLNLDGELIWKFKTEGAIYSKACLADINNDNKLEIIFGSCDNKIYALNSNGEKIWSYETDFWVVAPPIVDDIDGDGKLEVIAGSYDHNIYILDSEGSYKLDYVPGVSGVLQQAGNYTDVMTQEPGRIEGKKLWQYKTDGIIVGCGYIGEDHKLIVNTKPGKINNLAHKE
jgi:outer membrane protein assembly factor BamB